jgi:hypothetical protein
VRVSINLDGVTGTYARTALDATEGLTAELLETAPTSEVSEGDNNEPRSTKATGNEINGPRKKPDSKFIYL